MDSSNPEWSNQFSMDHYYESVQPVTVKVYHVDSKHSLEHPHLHELAGEVSFTMDALMDAKSQQLTLSLAKGSSR